MKYVVRCFNCDKIFVVDRAETGADIICPDCGSANSIKNVEQRIEDVPAKNEEVDPDLATIRSFSIHSHPIDTEESRFEKFVRKNKEQETLLDLFVDGSPMKTVLAIVAFLLMIVIWIIVGKDLY